MKQVLIVLTIYFLFTSCATLNNRAWTTSIIYTTEPSSIVFNKDTIRTVGNKAKIIVTAQTFPTIPTSVYFILPHVIAV